MIREFTSLFHYYSSKANSKFLQQWDLLLMATAIAFGVNIAVMLVELCFVGWKESSLQRVFVRPSRSAISDLLLFVLVQTALAKIIGSIMTFGVINIFTFHVKQNLAPWQVQLAMNPFLYYGVYLLFIDFFNYWNHRAFHQFEFLWEIHKFHHAATEMTVFTATRDHPIERIFGTVFVVLPVALLAPPASDVFWLTLFVATIGPLKHSALDLDWSWFGRYVIQSPRAHRIHHSVESRHHNKNYASIFSFWDHMFGTWYEPGLERPTLGVEDNPYNHRGTWWDILMCYRQSWAVVLRNAASMVKRPPPPSAIVFSWKGDPGRIEPRPSDAHADRKVGTKV